MPTDAELRERFREDDHPGRAIDLDAVLRRSRARRRPRLAAVAAGSVLAVAGIVVPVTIGLAAGQHPVLSAGSAGSSVSEGARGGGTPGATAPEIAAGGGVTIDRAPADKVNLCGAAPAEVAPAPNGLSLTVHTVEASATSRDIPVTVTLTNTGTQHLVGSTPASPAITLVRDDVVLWHSNGPVPMIAVTVDLEPGASMRYSASFEPRVCSTIDDEDPGFRTGLPPAGPGDYRVSAAIDFTPSDGSGSVLVTGQEATATLH